MRSKGDTWLCWNKVVKETMPRKTDAHKAMCRNGVEEWEQA